jgi:hypothetical protein
LAVFRLNVLKLFLDEPQDTGVFLFDVAKRAEALHPRTLSAAGWERLAVEVLLNGSGEQFLYANPLRLRQGLGLLESRRRNINSSLHGLILRQGRLDDQCIKVPASDKPFDRLIRRWPLSFDKVRNDPGFREAVFLLSQSCGLV